MNIQSFIKKGGLALQKASPTIAVVSGICFGLAGTVLACKATLKVDEVLDEARANVKKIHETAKNPEYAEVYPVKAQHRDLCITYGKTVWGLTKLYGKAIACGAVSIALILKGHRTLLKRVGALGATCALLSESLKRYRANVTEKYGEETERDIYYGAQTERVETVVTDEETGKEKKVKENVKVVDSERTVSPFAVLFDDFNPNFVKNDPEYNKDFLINVENEMSAKLERQGWLFLNDVRNALGYKPVPEGQIYGWIYDKDDPTRANCIDLGIDHIAREEVRDFRNGKERAFMIDFNVDGPIIETFHLFDKSNRAA